MKGHVSTDEFLRWLDREGDPRELTYRLLWHLIADCTVCARNWDTALNARVPSGSLLTEEQRREVARGRSLGDVVDRAIRAVRARKERFLGEGRQQQTERLAALRASLLGLPPKQRPEALKALPADALMLRLAEELAEEARRGMVEDPEQARHLARLAGLAAAGGYRDRLESLIAHDLRALAAALEGNAFRLARDFDVARACFSDALHLLPQGTGDPIVFADVLSYRASFLWDQWKLDEARRELRQVRRLCRALGEGAREGRALLQLATVEYDLGQPQQASKTVQAALPLLEAAALRLIAHENLALYLADSGRPEEAWALLGAHPSPPNRPRRFELLRRWKEALVHRALRRHEEAARLLEEVQGGFLAEKDPLNAAVASIDLALLFAETGRPEEVMRVSGEVLPALLPFDLPDQALAVCMLLQDAVEAQAVTVRLLANVQQRLRVPALWSARR